MFLNQPIEQMLRAELTALQTNRLKSMLRRVYEKSTFYNERITALNITPDKIESLTDIANLPFTTKQDLINNYPYGLLTMPVSGVSRFHLEEGTALGLTGQDIYQQIENAARSLVASNIIKGCALMLLSEGADCRTIQQAAEGIGVTALFNNFKAIKAQLTVLTDFGVTTLCGTKDDLQRFADAIQENPALKASLLVKSLLICTEEYPLKSAFTEQFTAPIYSLYGPSPIAPAGLAGECRYQNGLHVYEDSFYVEVIDEETKEVLPPGEPGELVVTTLTHEAMPLVRYQTGTNVILDDSPCPCGRTSIRIIQLK